MSTVAEKYHPKVVGLCKALKKGPVPVSKLTDEYKADDILGSAFADGLVMVGRKTYSIVPVGEMRIRKDAKGQLMLDENNRQIVDRDTKTLVENEWSWMDRTSQHRAPLLEILEEKVQEGVPELHVKLTSAGLAATA